VRRKVILPAAKATGNDHGPSRIPGDVRSMFLVQVAARHKFSGKVKTCP